MSKSRQNRSLDAAADAAYKDLRELVVGSGGTVSRVVKRPSLKVIRGLVTKPFAERKIELTVIGPPVIELMSPSGDEAYAFKVAATTRTLVLTNVEELTEHLSRGVITFTGVHTSTESGGGHYSVYTTRTTYQVELSTRRDLLGSIEKTDTHKSSSGM